MFVIGGEGLVEALEERGPAPGAGPRARSRRPWCPGFHPDLRWATVIAGAILVRDGLPWVASNTDLTVPTPDGPGPGNGVLVGAVARFAEVSPSSPASRSRRCSRRRCAGSAASGPLVVGDRLDTDIEGATRPATTACW